MTQTIEKTAQVQSRSIKGRQEFSSMRRWAVKAVWFIAALVFSVQAQAATYYFHNDHLGTPQVLTDDTQAVVWKGEYDPFGKVIETVNTVEQNLRFPGQYFDQETGLHYNYFRTYDPGTGRYVESDPIGLGGGLNTYGYVGGNLASRIDFFGLDAEDVRIIMADIRQHFPELTMPLWIEYRELEPGNVAQTSFYGYTIVLSPEMECKELSEESFENLYFTLLHESMHVTDSVRQRVIDGRDEFESLNERSIHQREFFERYSLGLGKPMWGNPSTPRGVSPIDLYYNTRRRI